MGQKGRRSAAGALTFGGEEIYGAGSGVTRRLVMHNDYIIAGPGRDPAKIKGTKSAAELSEDCCGPGTVCFEGDNSGTHSKEKEIEGLRGQV